MQLVLGTPDPVATLVAELLLAKGERVVVLGASSALEQREGLRLLVGDPTSIDFGLAAEDYAWLLKEVDSVYVALTDTTTPDDLERSPVVRTAAEVEEFVRAGGVGGGIHFLSSLLVFGNAPGPVTEEDFLLGQVFFDLYEESLAVAEKIIRSCAGARPLALLRVGAIVGASRTGTISPGSPLLELSRILSVEHSQALLFSDQPVRLESVERAAEALVHIAPSSPVATFHLVDEMPLTDRQLVHFVASQVGCKVSEVQGGARALRSLSRPRFPACRAVQGWGLSFGRTRADRELSELLDRDEEEFLQALFSARSHEEFDSTETSEKEGG